MERNMALMGATQRYQISHETTYVYSTMVTSGHHFAHLSPRDTEFQQVISHALDVQPPPTETSNIVDYYGNNSVRFLITRQHEKLVVTGNSIIDVMAKDFPDTQLNVPWETALNKSLYTVEPNGVAEMRLSSPHVECLPQTREYAERFFTPGRPWLEAVLDLTRHIRQEFAYDTEATTISTPVAEVFLNKRGVCQDFANLMLSCLRSLKLPARYVSGYILNEPPPGVEKLIGSDASHAWIETWLPGTGWIGFDPTNGKLANIEFIIVAWGRDFMDVTPLRGVVLGGGEHKLEVRVTVTPVDSSAIK